MQALFVPDEFRKKQGAVYPPDNFLDFEHWMAHQMDGIISDRTYLPICWTSFYVNANFGKSRGIMAKLEIYLRQLSLTGKKFWTVVQYDDGIITKLHNEMDIFVFGMAGGKVDYPIPLLCQPHKFRRTMRSGRFKANFVGGMTHPIRYAMMNALPVDAKYFLNTARMGMDMYMNVLADSDYTLCPRGYGPSSFRIMEAIHAKSVPVYISDHFIEPYGIDFNEYGIKVHEHDLPNLQEILENADFKAKKKRMLELQPLFTYEGCKAEIAKVVINNDFNNSPIQK